MIFGHCSLNKCLLYFQHVGWWSPTIVRGDDREAVHIPNHKFTVSVVRNLSQKSHWRIKTYFGISHLDVTKLSVRAYLSFFCSFCFAFAVLCFLRDFIYPEYCSWHEEGFSEASSSRAKKIAPKSVFWKHQSWKPGSYGDVSCYAYSIKFRMSQLDSNVLCFWIMYNSCRS